MKRKWHEKRELRVFLSSTAKLTLELPKSFCSRIPHENNIPSVTHLAHIFLIFSPQGIAMKPVKTGESVKKEVVSTNLPLSAIS
jgi:hypothetical protein